MEIMFTEYLDYHEDNESMEKALRPYCSDNAP